MAEALTAMRWQRSTICASITKVEAIIVRWEVKAELVHSGHCAIQSGVETLTEYNADFKRNHFAIVELANEEELEAEQAGID